ncbi:MAG: arylesterase [Desulfobulbaceae bacterium]|jgi:acyl-CoA thioesterase-1|nr:arylesterase [Desulfobulbaceae bacterium]
MKPFILATMMILTLSACHDEQKPDAAEASAPEITIVAMGDSLTAGYGLPEEDAYPAKLERRLRAEGYNCCVINAGVSGETSSDALSRLDWVLSMNPGIVILETGANDGLRGINPAVPRENIDKILTRLKEKGVVTVFTGMRMAMSLGPAYVAEFNAIYPDLAKKHQALFMPFFLEGVAAKPRLNQDDGIHPLAAGYEIIAENILPPAREAVARRRQGNK